MDEGSGDRMQVCADFLEYCSGHRDSICNLLRGDPGRVREWAAEQGLELTPDECADLLNILRVGVDLVDG